MTLGELDHGLLPVGVVAVLEIRRVVAGREVELERKRGGGGCVERH